MKIKTSVHLAKVQPGGRIRKEKKIKTSVHLAKVQPGGRIRKEKKIKVKTFRK